MLQLPPKKLNITKTSQPKNLVDLLYESPPPSPTQLQEEKEEVPIPSFDPFKITPKFS